MDEDFLKFLSAAAAAVIVMKKRRLRPLKHERETWSRQWLMDRYAERTCYEVFHRLRVE
jgi:hypothetical protein